MSVVSSITITAPGAEHRAGGAGERALERDVELVGDEPRRRAAAGHERLQLVVVADALAELLAVDQVAERRGAVDDLEHAGPLDVPGHGDHARARASVAVPIAVYAAVPLTSSHGRLASVSTLLTIVGLPYRPTAAGKYGGFSRGMPRLPSRLSISAVSSPTT